MLVYWTFLAYPLSDAHEEIPRRLFRSRNPDRSLCMPTAYAHYSTLALPQIIRRAIFYPVDR
jgi:hypothetical protein